MGNAVSETARKEYFNCDKNIKKAIIPFGGCAEERPPQSGFFNDTKIERN